MSGGGYELLDNPLGAGAGCKMLQRVLTLGSQFFDMGPSGFDLVR